MNHARDAFLAAASGGALLAAVAATRSFASLVDPVAAATGVAVALAVEALFVVDTPAGRLWERQRVRVASVAVLLSGSAAVAWLAGPWILAVACWGVATYFALLALVLAGVWGGDGTDRNAGDDRL